MHTEADGLVEMLKSAIPRDDVPRVRELLVAHPQLKAKLNEPLGPFDSLAINWVRSPGMLDLLVDAGADINARSRWWAGGFGILDAAEPELAAHAIARGARVDAHAAARLGMLDRLRELIGVEPALVHSRGGDGQIPLHFATTIEIAQYLLDQGADIDARDIDHESTPAQYLVRDQQPVARYLISRGCKTDILMAAALGDVGLVRKHLDADPACVRMSVCEQHFPKQDPRSGGMIYFWKLGANKTAHLIAREFGHEGVFQLLMQRTSEELKLSLACELGDEETFKALLASRPDLVRTLSDDDRGKLPNAAQNNNTRAVRLMLSAGWPADARGQHGGTALHWAAFHGNAEIVREILRYSPPLDLLDSVFHASPLGWATHGSEHSWHRQTGNYEQTVELLCAAGAKLPEDLPGTEPVKLVLRRYQERAHSAAQSGHQIA